MLANVFTSASQLLAGQLGGSEQVIGAGFTLMLCAAFWAVGWNRRQRADKKPGMASMFFIAACFAIALVAVGCAAYGLGLRSNSRPAGSNENGHVTKLISEAHIEWDPTGRIFLQGKFERVGGPVTVYISSGEVSTPLSKSPVITGKIALGPRIKIATIQHFDRDEKSNILIGSIGDVPGNPPGAPFKSVHWGTTGDTSPATYSSNFGIVILVWNDGKDEEFYPFALVSRATLERANPPQDYLSPIIVGPDILGYLESKHAK